MLDASITRALSSRYWKIAFVLALVTLAKLTSIAVPLLLGHIVDGLASGNGTSAQSVPLLLLAFCIAGGVQVVVMPIQSLHLSRLVQECVCESSLHWARCVMGKEFEAFSAMRLGNLISTVDRGVNAHERLLSFILLSGLPLAVETLIVSVVLLVYGGAWVFLSVLVGAAGYLYLNHRIIRWRRVHIDALNDQEDEVASTFAQTFGVAKAIKCEGVPESAFASLDAAYRGYAAAATRIGFSASLLGAAKALFICLSTAGILFFGFMDQRSSDPYMSIGEMVAMFTLAIAFFNSVASMAEAQRFTDQFASDQKRFREVLGLEDFRAVAASLDDAPGMGLVLQPVRVLRAGARLLQLTQPLSLASDESVAIIGSSGAGKTTLLEVLAGIVRESRNCLRIGAGYRGEPAAERQFSLLRYCPQSPALLSGELMEAVLFGQPHDQTLLRDYLRRMGLMRLAAELCGFKVQNQGTNLSGGEMKRLSLLRVLMRPGAFNLFDEPTASLDTVSARQVWDLLFERFKGMALICVTHDMQALPRFDRVLVVDGGEIVASGSWSELEQDARVQDVLQRMQECTVQADAHAPS
ncbi:ATP-binding cassette domain-containing protein [Pseudomonas tohonis]|uniref:ATP-binding cassette domain-containing protein n=1 Tax=Pseudomonas tohonis TaxID=2725477 RepID=UPI001F180F96|nr:ABC transporter ATP-binding protein [Pseudomonas tohonis]